LEVVEDNERGQLTNQGKWLLNGVYVITGVKTYFTNS